VSGEVSDVHDDEEEEDASSLAVAYVEAVSVECRLSGDGDGGAVENGEPGMRSPRSDEEHEGDSDLCDMAGASAKNVACRRRVLACRLPL